MGYININTNAGLTDHIRGIVDAGLDLMRVSTISALDDHYNAYYKPRAIRLKMLRNLSATLRIKESYTSINYLDIPWRYRSRRRDRSDDRIRAKNGTEIDSIA